MGVMKQLAMAGMDIDDVSEVLTIPRRAGRKSLLDREKHQSIMAYCKTHDLVMWDCIDEHRHICIVCTDAQKEHIMAIVEKERPWNIKRRLKNKKTT